MKSLLRAGAAVLASSLLFAGGLAAPAHAADVINPDAPVTLTIQKYEGNTGDQSTPLDGARFDVQRISSVDLTTDDGWASLSAAAAELTDGDTDYAGQTLDAPISVTTANGGIATLTNPTITVGAYLVTEKQFGAYSVAKPFIVTLPWSDPTSGTWNYAQTVYPKNQNIQPTKAVDATGATVGKPLTYTITAPVPATPLNQFEIVDALSSDLALVNPITSLTAGALTLVAGTDYTVDYSNNTLHIVFTPAGLEALTTARTTDPGLAVVATFDATVTSIPATGTINNTATVTINGAPLTTDTPDTNTPVSTTFATATITKTTSDGQPADGAVFEIYTCTKNDATDAWTLNGDALSLASTPTGTSATSFTTAGGVTATANAYGVPVTSTSTSTAGTVSTSYCALETKAPANYLRTAEIYPLSYDAAAHTLTTSVVNQRNTILGQLPATGAWGLLLALVVGGGLVLRGVLTSRRDAGAHA